MSKIRSSKDVCNNYNEISSFCHDYNEPVFITKNGKDDLAGMCIKTYENMKGRFEIYSRIYEGMQDVENGRTRPVSEVFADLRKKRKNELEYFLLYTFQKKIFVFSFLFR